MARRIEVEIVGDSRSLERAFARSEKSAQQFSRTVSKTSKSFSLLGAGARLGAGVVGFQTLADAARISFHEMESGAQVAAQTAAAIKSTGGAANVTAKHVNDLANVMLKKTGIDDEATQASENMLLAFRNVRNEAGRGNNIFDRATTAVADLATRMNKGATPSADQMRAASVRLGKALNDPVKGLGALARVGIQFSDAQRQQIKALVDSGRTMEAQKIILDNLNRSVGGAADAAGKTLPGQLAILKESLINLGGSIATGFTPIIQDATGALLDMGGAFDTVREKSKHGWGRAFRPFTMSLSEQLKWFDPKRRVRVIQDYLSGEDHFAKGSPLGRGTPAQFRSQLAPLVPGGLWLKPPTQPQLRTVEDAGKQAGVAIRKAWAKGANSKQARAQVAAASRYRQMRNTWFDELVGRQLGRVGDVGPRQQLGRLRVVADELRRQIQKTQDPTRRINLQDQLLDVLKQERDVQQQITDNIKAGNQALRDRADQIKSAVLNQLQRGQTALENRQQLQDALRQLALARHIGGPMGIQAAARDVQKARFAISYAGLEAAPARLKGGQFAYAGVTINVHGVTDPEQVARTVVAVLERRKRHTSTQSRGASVDAGASTAPR